MSYYFFKIAQKRENRHINSYFQRVILLLIIAENTSTSVEFLTFSGDHTPRPPKRETALLFLKNILTLYIYFNLRALIICTVTKLVEA